MTIGSALNTSDRPISYREAEIFLQDILGKPREWLHAHPEVELTEKQLATFEEYCLKRAENQPVAYITGHKEFYGREFNIDPRALIPRPETEGLIDMVLAWAPAYFTSHTKASNKPCPVRILELGTGSGNIASTLALELSTKNTPAQILATDISPEALVLAEENWKLLSEKEPNNLVNLKFIKADLFGHDLIKKLSPYDLIIANLPYVPSFWKMDSSAQAEVVFHEPDIALFGGEDGLDIYRSFLGQARRFLADHGKVVFEFGFEDSGQETKTVLELVAKDFPDATTTIHKDYAGLDRIVEVQT